MFSLGCVFAEVLTGLSSRNNHDFFDARSNGSHAYHLNLRAAVKWLNTLQAVVEPSMLPIISSTIRLLSENSDHRPTSTALLNLLTYYHSKERVLFCDDCVKTRTAFQVDPGADKSTSTVIHHNFNVARYSRSLLVIFAVLGSRFLYLRVRLDIQNQLILAFISVFICAWAFVFITAVWLLPDNLVWLPFCYVCPIFIGVWQATGRSNK